MTGMADKVSRAANVRQGDGLSAIRGLMFGLPIGALIWALLILAVTAQASVGVWALVMP